MHVPDTFVLSQFDLLAYERMIFASLKTGERHSVAGSDFRIHFVDFTNKSIQREPGQRELATRNKHG